MVRFTLLVLAILTLHALTAADVEADHYVRSSCSALAGCSAPAATCATGPLTDGRWLRGRERRLTRRTARRAQRQAASCSTPAATGCGGY